MRTKALSSTRSQNSKIVPSSDQPSPLHFPATKIYSPLSVQPSTFRYIHLMLESAKTKEKNKNPPLETHEGSATRKFKTIAKRAPVQMMRLRESGSCGKRAMSREPHHCLG
jgi:hypothetical protein